MVFFYLNYSTVCLAVSFFPVFHAAFIISYFFQSISSDSSQIPQHPTVDVLLPSSPRSKIRLLPVLRLLTISPFIACCAVLISMAGTLWVQTTTSSANCENGTFSSRLLLEYNHSHLPQCWRHHSVTPCIPAELLRDYSGVKTWACFCLPAGTNAKKSIYSLYSPI